MSRHVWIIVFCVLLSLGPGPAWRAAPPGDAVTDRGGVTLVGDDESAGLPPRPVTAPLPSAGIGGLALLSLMMLRRWFRQRL